MIIDGLNAIAIVAAAIAAFAFGAIYYTALSGPWSRAQGRAPSDFRPTSKLFGLTFAGLLVMSVVLAGLLGHIAEWSIVNGIISAVLVWVGFVVTSLTINNAYQGKDIRLTMIDCGYWLGVLLIMGSVIGWFGV